MSDKLSDEEVEKRRKALDALHEFANMFQDAQIEKEEEACLSTGRSTDFRFMLRLAPYL